MLLPLRFGIETLAAVQLLHRAGHYPQLLAVLYSAIDTLAWLDSPAPWATGTSFKTWVDRYLLPKSRLRCTAEDLWAARCGLLHTRTAESKTTQQGTARQIWYYGRKRSRRLIRKRIAGRTDVVPVRLVSLIAAFAKATERFSKTLDRDKTTPARIRQRAEKWLHWVPA